MDQVPSVSDANEPGGDERVTLDLNELCSLRLHLRWELFSRIVLEKR